MSHGIIAVPVIQPYFIADQNPEPIWIVPAAVLNRYLGRDLMGAAT